MNPLWQKLKTRIKDAFSFNSTTRKKRKAKGINSTKDQTKTSVARNAEAAPPKRVRKKYKGEVQEPPVAKAFVGPFDPSLPTATADAIPGAEQDAKTVQAPCAATPPPTPTKKPASGVPQFGDSPATRVNKVAKLIAQQTDLVKDVISELQARRLLEAYKKLGQQQNRLDAERNMFYRKLEKGEREKSVSKEQASCMISEVEAVNPLIDLEFLLSAGHGSMPDSQFTQATQAIYAAKTTRADQVASATQGGSKKPLKASPDGVVDFALGMPSATTKASEAGFFVSAPKCLPSPDKSVEFPCR